MMTTEIIKDLTTMQMASDIMSKQVFRWGSERVAAQRTQEAILTTIQENKDFEMRKCIKQTNENMNNL